MASILILTYNEELNLSRCLESVKWSDDVVVLDSYSNDRTVKIAEEYGVRVVQRTFDNYSGQRCYGLDEIEYRHPWVLMVDADEEVTPELAEEIQSLVSREDSSITLYRFRRRDFFMGRWIKRSSGYPTWFGRLVKLGHIRIERVVNEEYVTDGEVGLLRNHVNHYPFNKGVAAWIDKHNRYSTMEAQLLIDKSLPELRFKDFFSRDPATRRIAVKALVYKLPGRPLLMFFALYVFKGGFLDGLPGFIFCNLRGYYEFMIDIKVREKKMRQEEL